MSTGNRNPLINLNNLIDSFKKLLQSDINTIVDENYNVIKVNGTNGTEEVISRDENTGIIVKYINRLKHERVEPFYRALVNLKDQWKNTSKNLPLLNKLLPIYEQRYTSVKKLIDELNNPAISRTFDPEGDYLRDISEKYDQISLDAVVKINGRRKKVPLGRIKVYVDEKDIAKVRLNDLRKCLQNSVEQVLNANQSVTKVMSTTACDKINRLLEGYVSFESDLKKKNLLGENGSSDSRGKYYLVNDWGFRQLEYYNECCEMLKNVQLWIEELSQVENSIASGNTNVGVNKRELIEMISRELRKLQSVSNKFNLYYQKEQSGIKFLGGASPLVEDIGKVILVGIVVVVIILIICKLMKVDIPWKNIYANSGKRTNMENNTCKKCNCKHDKCTCDICTCDNCSCNKHSMDRIEVPISTSESAFLHHVDTTL